MNLPVVPSARTNPPPIVVSLLAGNRMPRVARLHGVSRDEVKGTFRAWAASANHRCIRHQAHGLTCGDYERLRDRADDSCEICGLAGAEASRWGCLYIDHDHETHVVRGLLCHRCNSALGRSEKDAGPWPSIGKGRREFTPDELAYLALPPFVPTPRPAARPTS